MAAPRPRRRLAPGASPRGGASLAAMLAGAAFLFAPPPALAQASGGSDGEPLPGKSRMLVEAKELIYDNDSNKVVAKGDVQIYYQGRTLEADRVTYDRAGKRVLAEGNAKITEANGTVNTGDRFELTDDFKDGFIESLKVVTYDKQRFTSARGERVGGETTVFERGTYTSCEPCKDNPDKAPLWQVRAARIIHKKSEQTIYYEDSRLEFFGLPVAYLPFFSAPDPSVTRKTGFLSPTALNKTSLGFGVGVPYFWAIAPNMDLTATPTYFSRQGLLAAAEFRHRVENGTYAVRASGIFQQDKAAFRTTTLGAGERDFRGSIESSGRFFISDKWKFGWSVSAATDRFYQQNYNLRPENVSLSYNYFKESISSGYLTGQTSRSFFDARGYYFRGLSLYDWQKTLPVVLPVVDYDRRFTPSLIGGELDVNVNLTALHRDVAAYQDLPPFSKATAGVPAAFFRSLSPNPTRGYVLYPGCVVYQPGQCLVRGLGGDYARLSAEAIWRRRFVDDLGMVWTPFAGLRLDAIGLDAKGADPVNTYQSAFLRTGSDATARAVPMAGLEWRYPFVGGLPWGTQSFEPIAQLIARPNAGRVGRLPNEDAQSLVFDDTNVFSLNKFSGYDRVESGVRANYGAQYTMTFKSGGYVNLLAGQSYHLVGNNPFAQPDLANVGQNSGLETRRSDYVGRVTVAPSTAFSLTARARFDQESLALRRLEVGGTTTQGPVTFSSTYGRYAAQPLLGTDTRREGWLNAASVKVFNNWNVNGSVLFDMSRYLINARLYELYGSDPTSPVLYKRPNTSPFTVASLSAGFGYVDECTNFSVTYSRGINDVLTSGKTTSQTVLVKLELKHLGQLNLNQSLGAVTTPDSLSR